MEPQNSIYKITLITLILGIYLFLISHFRLNNSSGTYILDYSLVNATEIITNEEKNILNNKVTEQTTHILIVEYIKIFFEIFFFPCVSIYFFIFTKKGKKIFKNTKAYFINKLIAYRLNEAYREGKEELIAKTLLDNALLSASSSDPQKKLTGIQQLCQFTEDRAIFGLIGILANEKDMSFVRSIIYALHSMIEKRAKKNEI